MQNETRRRESALRHPWFHVCALITLVGIASGIPYFQLARLMVVLIIVGAVVDRRTSTPSVARSFLTVGFLLSVTALAWVLAVSTHQWWWRLAVIGSWLIGMIALLRIHSDIYSASPEHSESRIELVDASVALPIVLVAQGWTHMIPLAVAIVASATVPARTANTELRRGLRFASMLLVLVGAFLSRHWLGREDLRIWTSFDQNFRASLATGLTRWGWTDWNAAADQPIRYHWLSEATAGLLSRVTGIDEFDSVTRLLPILGVFGALLVGRAVLTRLGVQRLAASLTTAITVGIHDVFSMYSIGTLWGMFLGWGILLLITHLAPNDRVSGTSFIHGVGMSVACTAVLLSQSTVGVTIGAVVGITHLVLLFRRRLRVLQLLAAGIPLASLYGLAGFTLLRGQADSTTEVTRIPVLTHGIIGLPESFTEAFTFWLEPIPQALLVPLFLASVALGTLYLKSVRLGVASLLVGIFLGSVLIVINVIRIGGYEERFVREGLVVASLFGIGGLAHALTSDVSRFGRLVLAALAVFIAVRRFEFWQTPISAVPTIKAHIVVIGITMVGAAIVNVLPRLRPVGLAAAAVALGSVIGFFHESVEKRITLATRDVAPLDTVNGDADINACMAWVRTNTDTETLIASNMWRIPNGDSQKYFLVSQKAKRRVIIDGPDYVANAGAFSDRKDLEARKDFVDRFVESPTLRYLYDLRQTGAEYLIVDNQRSRSARLSTFAGQVLSNVKCSVYRL